MPRMSTDPELTTAQSKYVESLARAGAEVHWVALSDPDAAVAEALTCDGLHIADRTPFRRRKAYRKKPSPAHRLP